jgi:Resolvase, N terminal domain
VAGRRNGLRRTSLLVVATAVITAGITPVTSAPYLPTDDSQPLEWLPTAGNQAGGNCADFAKLVELFDEHTVSFVSVTQSFNTTSSMGRLTLNVLLSFAQFEREVIGERVRDKIAASKSKGIWVGSPVSLGYRSTAKKLEVVPEDAALVRKIFADYLRLGSIGELAASLDRDGIRPRPRKLANGRVVVAERFMVGPLAHILTQYPSCNL